MPFIDFFKIILDEGWQRKYQRQSSQIHGKAQTSKTTWSVHWKRGVSPDNHCDGRHYKETGSQKPKSNRSNRRGNLHERTTDQSWKRYNSRHFSKAIYITVLIAFFQSFLKNVLQKSPGWDIRSISAFHIKYTRRHSKHCSLVFSVYL